MPTTNALIMAKDKGLDLLEVAPNENPPVCKIIDYGKYKYRQNKKSQEARKRQKIIQIKEIKLRPKTEEHDYRFKINHVRRFLAGGDKAKITIIFKGREFVHMHLGEKMLERVAEDIKDIGSIEQEPKKEGRNLTMTIIPNKYIQKQKDQSEIEDKERS
jgi:translation initiation factor IF-3